MVERDLGNKKSKDWKSSIKSGLFSIPLLKSDENKLSSNLYYQIKGEPIFFTKSETNQLLHEIQSSHICTQIWWKKI